MSVPPAPPPCPRCGRSAPPGTGPFCPWCGRYLAALDWVATPPDPATLPASVRPRAAAPRRARYAGPPHYRRIPRWGLPVGPWRAPEPDAGAAAPAERARSLGAQLGPVLWVAAGSAVVAALAEIWRYGLLLASRTDALSATAVGWSDALVRFGGWASLVATIAVAVLLVPWSLAASRAAARRSGTRPSRSRAVVVAGWLVPGWNLVAPGSLLAETEHAALGLPPAQRPRPSRTLLVWWALWGACVVLAAVTLLWSLRGGTQAMADGVVLHAWLDVLAAVTAWWTRRVVRWITGLLEPGPRGPRELLVGPGAGPARPEWASAEPDSAPDARSGQAAPTAAPDGRGGAAVPAGAAEG
ncbi:DUF4328 domain-containing protein [Pseudonocardia phyllosphaerae]|uniref:DUF4328 domain-containing protein n=1 Tax=Pseudonocardia phyllosphaerae TaxID=3390502 RepID=UPI00397811E1